MRDARDYKATVWESELLVSSPDRVVNFLKERADLLADGKVLNDIDEETEISLLRLNHPLINIGLAKYCRFGKTARLLFNAHLRKGLGSGEPEINNALRLAVLSNQVLSNSLFGGLSLRNLFYEHADVNCDDDATDPALKIYIRNASNEEMYALFHNPNVNHETILDFLEEKFIWQESDCEKKMWIVNALAHNKKIWEEEYRYRFGLSGFLSNVEAAWGLAGKVTVNDSWAAVLSMLFSVLPRDRGGSTDGSIELAERWRPSPKEVDVSQEEKAKEIGFTSTYQNIRLQLARQALDNFKITPDKLLQSEDIALRAAVYVDTDLTDEDICIAIEKDRNLAAYTLVENKFSWKNEGRRKLLADALERAKVQEMAFDHFHSYRELFKKEYPEWFGEEKYKSKIKVLDDKITTLISFSDWVKEKVDKSIKNILTIQRLLIVGILLGIAHYFF